MAVKATLKRKGAVWEIIHVRTEADQVEGLTSLLDSITIDALDDITDVIITAPENGEVLTYNNGNWINSTAISGVMSYTTDTAAATAAKTITTTDVPSAGSLYGITFTYGNTAIDTTLKFGGGTAYPLKLNNVNTNTATFTLNTGSIVLLFFNGAAFHVIGTQRIVKDIYFTDDLPVEADRHVNLIWFDI